jgi:hypothetical protein
MLLPLAGILFIYCCLWFARCQRIEFSKNKRRFGYFRFPKSGGLAQDMEECDGALLRIDLLVSIASGRSVGLRRLPTARNAAVVPSSQALHPVVVHVRLLEVHKALPVTPFGRSGLHAKCDLSGRLGAHAIQKKPQPPPTPIRELQLIPACLLIAALVARASASNAPSASSTRARSGISLE